MVFCLIGLVVLYCVIRLAVSHGMRDALKRSEWDSARVRGEWEAWKRGEWEAWKHGHGDDK